MDDEDQLLYINWDKQEKSKEDIEEIYQAALESEKINRSKIQGLAVLQDMPLSDDDIKRHTSVVPADKTEWKNTHDLQTLLLQYFDQLSMPEQEEVLIAISDNLTEEQLVDVFLSPLEIMAEKRYQYKLVNEIRRNKNYDDDGTD